MCGECCKNLDKSLFIPNWTRALGLVSTWLVICAVFMIIDLFYVGLYESYEAFFKDIYGIDEYYRLIYEACIKLKNIKNLGG
jgi:hypothetical protein